MNNYFNGAKIYNLYINGKQQENSDDDDFECVNLEFFDEKIFCTYERQLALRNLFRSIQTDGFEYRARPCGNLYRVSLLYWSTVQHEMLYGLHTGFRELVARQVAKDKNG